MSLVADYGTSSSESDADSSDSDNTETQNEDLLNRPHCQTLQTGTGGEKLPGPAFGNSSTSVFSNPFIEAENAKKAILEKHVKMVPTKEDTQVINGKKICWNYRKGRCRFGHKCTFAHDSDLQKTSQELEEEFKIQTTVICQNNVLSESGTDNQNLNKNKRKRPGLTQGLVPGKKVMKQFHSNNHNQNQDKGAPWTTHK